MAGPLVRSSYRAGRLYAQTVRAPRRGALARAGPPRRRGRRAAGGALAARPVERRSRRPAPTIVGWPRPYPGGMPAKPKLDKAAKKEARREKRAASKARRRQIWEAFKIQRREDKKLVPLMVGAFLVCRRRWSFGIGLIFDVQWLVLPIGIAIGVLAAVSIFGRRVQRSVYSKAEGQPGAAGWALEQHARPVAGHPGRRGHHAPRRRAPGDRPARASSWSPRAPRTGSRACWRRRRSATPGWWARPRSTTSSSATTRARSRWASCSATS